MNRIDNILSICEKSLERRDNHEHLISIIKKCTEYNLNINGENEEKDFDKARKISNVNYLLEQKRLDFVWRMNRIFQGLDENELKIIRKDAEVYELKILANTVIKEKINEN